MVRSLVRQGLVLALGLVCALPAASTTACKACNITIDSSDVRVDPLNPCLVAAANHASGACCHGQAGVTVTNHCSSSLSFLDADPYVPAGQTVTVHTSTLASGRRVATGELGGAKVSISWVDSDDDVSDAQRHADNQGNGCTADFHDLDAASDARSD
jgi:hypothetical protein